MTHRPINTPTSAETTLPPTVGHGCASGEAGTAKTSTADAATGGAIHGNAGPSPCTSAPTSPTKANPAAAPTAARARSPKRPPTKIGTNRNRPNKEDKNCGQGTVTAI
jgi:hypothetical protein